MAARIVCHNFLIIDGISLQTQFVVYIRFILVNTFLTRLSVHCNRMLIFNRVLVTIFVFSVMGFFV